MDLFEEQKYQIILKLNSSKKTNKYVVIDALKLGRV